LERIESFLNSWKERRAFGGIKDQPSKKENIDYYCFGSFADCCFACNFANR
jgi:hypothetical protein